MKSVLIWGLILAAVLGIGALLPFESKDVSQLVPVEALVVSIERDQIILNGGDCQGKGETWEAAWQDLQNSAEGHVFFGTAEQVVLAGAAVKLLQEAATSKELRPAANICAALGQVPDPKKAAAYLSAHNGGLTLQKVRAALKQGERLELPVLIIKEGGMRLYDAGSR